MTELKYLHTNVFGIGNGFFLSKTCDTKTEKYCCKLYFSFWVFWIKGRNSYNEALEYFDLKIILYVGLQLYAIATQGPYRLHMGLWWFFNTLNTITFMQKISQ